MRGGRAPNERRRVWVGQDGPITQSMSLPRPYLSRNYLIWPHHTCSLDPFSFGYFYSELSLIICPHHTSWPRHGETELVRWSVDGRHAEPSSYCISQQPLSSHVTQTLALNSSLPLIKLAIAHTHFTHLSLRTLRLERRATEGYVQQALASGGIHPTSGCMSDVDLQTTMEIVAVGYL